MKWFRCNAWLLILAALLASGCGRKSVEVLNLRVDEEDPEMKAAIAKARASLPGFWQRVESPSGGESGFSLMVKMPSPEGGTYVWTKDVERKQGKIWGTISCDVNTMQNIDNGERMEIPPETILDWMYLRNGKMVGCATLPTLFKQMPPDRVERYKELMASE